MAEELAVLPAAVSSTVEFVLRRSPNKAFWVKVVDRLVDKL
jgi:hypothetical protein